MIAAGRGRIDPARRVALAVLLVLAWTLGGRADGGQFVAVVIATVAVAVMVLSPLPASSDDRIRSGFLMLALATLFLLVLQIVPLPHAMWSALPLHEVAGSIAAAAGIRPAGTWSVDPAATTGALLALAGPVAAFVAMQSLDVRDARRVLLLVLSLAGVTLLLGLMQYAAQGLYLYQTTHDGYATGVFSNRNHAADAMVVVLALAAHAIGWAGRTGRIEPRMRSVLYAGVAIVVVLALFAAASRTGLILGLLALPVGAVIALGIGGAGGGRDGRRSVLIGTAVVIGVVATLFVAARHPVFAVAIERFTREGDSRFETWPMIFALARDAWPWGTGIASFERVHGAAETIEMLRPRYLNAAHNDYLQLLLEGGIAAVVLLLMFAALVVAAIVRVLRQPWQSGSWSMGMTMALVIGTLAAHSVVDYPLRTEALSITFAVALGLLVRCPAFSDERVAEVSGRGTSRSHRRRRSLRSLGN